MQSLNKKAEQIMQLNDLGKSQINTAKTSHLNAVVNNNIAVGDMKLSMKNEKDFISNNYEKRIDAVLSLNENIKISRTEVKDSAGKNEYK